MRSCGKSDTQRPLEVPHRWDEPIDMVRGKVRAGGIRELLFDARLRFPSDWSSYVCRPEPVAPAHEMSAFNITGGQLR